MDSILLLGVNSYLGSTYLKYLRTKPACRVVGVYRTAWKSLDDDTESNARLVMCDLFDVPLLTSIIRNSEPDVIINFAAKLGVSDVPEDYNEALANSISQAITLANVRCKIVHIGSAAEYSPNTSGTFSESCASGGLSPYGRSKWRQWQTLEQRLSESNCGLLGLRIFNVIAPEMNERFLISTIAKQVKSGSKIIILGELGSVRDFVDIRDVMSAIYLAQCSDVSGAFLNVCSGCSYSVMQIVDAFSIVTARELQVKSVSDRKRVEDVSVAVGCRARVSKALGWNPKFSLLDSITMLMEGV